MLSQRRTNQEDPIENDLHQIERKATDDGDDDKPSAYDVHIQQLQDWCMRQEDDESFEGHVHRDIEKKYNGVVGNVDIYEDGCDQFECQEVFWMSRESVMRVP